MEKQAKELLERAASLVGNPGTNISGSTDVACKQWQDDYERWKNLSKKVGSCNLPHVINCKNYESQNI